VSLGGEIDAVAEAIHEASMDPDLRAEMNAVQDGELRKAGNSLWKYNDGQKEAPSGPSERKYIREIFGSALDELRQDPQYADLTMADLQAVLWYAEKRLYETAKEEVTEDDVEGYTDSDAPDYANAAAMVARAQGVSERRINNALKREENGRATGTRSGNGEQASDQAGEQGQGRGFTQKEQRAFIRARAVHRVRSNQLNDAKPSGSFTRRGVPNRSGLRVLRGLGVSIVAEWAPGKTLAATYRNNGLTPVTLVELAKTPENAAAFADKIIKVKESLGRAGDSVYVYPADDYAGMTLLLTEDGTAGVAVKQDGDIVSVFSGKGKAGKQR
jgi:hypothetical protein